LNLTNHTFKINNLSMRRAPTSLRWVIAK